MPAPSPGRAWAGGRSPRGRRRGSALPIGSEPSSSFPGRRSACLAHRLRTLVVIPGKAFCSWSARGIPSSAAAIPAGPPAYPPVTTTTPGRMRRSSDTTRMRARRRSTTTPAFRTSDSREKLLTGTRRCSTPRAGSTLASIPLSAPTKIVSTSGRMRPRASARARAGYRCPPVPPPENTATGPRRSSLRCLATVFLPSDRHDDAKCGQAHDQV